MPSHVARLHGLQSIGAPARQKLGEGAALLVKLGVEVVDAADEEQPGVLRLLEDGVEAAQVAFASSDQHQLVLRNLRHLVLQAPDGHHLKPGAAALCDVHCQLQHLLGDHFLGLDVPFVGLRKGQRRASFVPGGAVRLMQLELLPDALAQGIRAAEHREHGLAAQVDHLLLVVCEEGREHDADGRRRQLPLPAAQAPHPIIIQIDALPDAHWELALLLLDVDLGQAVRVLAADGLHPVLADLLVPGLDVCGVPAGHRADGLAVQVGGGAGDGAAAEAAGHVPCLQGVHLFVEGIAAHVSQAARLAHQQLAGLHIRQLQVALLNQPRRLLPYQRLPQQLKQSALLLRL
mmetsp:Transcript_40796/g.103365  ORF Transcript_40796/g.103365 Transcript_40796/m.103365 type:complete len:347 (+) Transcript_40796:922-1962(+)